MASTSTSSQTSTSPQYSSTSNPNNYNPMISTIFGTDKSPSLVVAFLTIGLFLVIMAVLFGWRRLHRGRLLVQPARPARVRPRKKPTVLGEKPTLWDMWTRREEVMIDLKWENITPFCAMVFCPPQETPRPPVLTKVTVEPQNPPRSSFVMTRISTFGRHFRLMNPPPVLPPEPQMHELDDVSERPGSKVPSLDGPSVVMAFTIAMPSPNTSGKRGSDNSPSSEVSDGVSTPKWLHDVTELEEYCIGSVEVKIDSDDKEQSIYHRKF
ncbi:uncharacterized protein EDB93DRAFT_1102361 [Suillus bovinus]|uniref:uncharacterized protein n=1 Tax=Suillus bovinus TaxID=48563 RepID=UPI001B867225|nr:uncharacterized protein EDB93DRAFT_1102361 [Suillus bovinus]KAG2154216.1 hypothetical protein EDB93DRAFT_1102361 [Suillus bovinus]